MKLVFIRASFVFFNIILQLSPFCVNSQVVTSHGSKPSGVVVHALFEGNICIWDDSVKSFRDSLRSYFGQNVCFVNHIVAPDWNPDCNKSSIGGLVDSNTINCLGDCQIQELQPFFNLKDEWCSAKSLDPDSITIKSKLDSVFYSLIEPQIANTLSQTCGSTGSEQNRFRSLCQRQRRSFCKCVDRYSSVTSRYVRDRFLVNGATLVSTWSPSMASVEIKEHSEFLKAQCGCDLLSDSAVSKVQFEGGDILVSDSFALIGKNIGANYLIKQTDQTLEQIRASALATLGLQVANVDSTDFDTLLTCIKSELFPDKEIMFVGLDSRQFTDISFAPESNRYRSYQPAYHLDMFVALIGKADDDTFRVLVARPHEKYLNVSVLGSQDSVKATKFIVQFNEYLDTIEEKMKTFIQQYHAHVKFVEVPMPASLKKYDNDNFALDKHFAFVNGISFTDNGKHKFVYPNYLPSTYSNSIVNYNLAHEDFVKSLKANGIEPLPVTYSFGKNAGLDCITLVLKR
jgi:hypothetical protein